MRKVNVQGVKDDFINSLDEVEEFFLRASPMMGSESDKSFLAKSAFLSAAVLWEGFVSDLFVAYINRDSSMFVNHLNNAIHGSSNLTDKQRLIVNKYSKISFPAHLNRSSIIELIDGKGNNISFASFKALEDTSKKWLIQQDSRRIASASAQLRAVYDAILSIRNFIAHNSERSHKAMNQALSGGPIHPLGLTRPTNSVNKVGSYLKSKPINVNGNQSRLEIFFDGMRSLAQHI